MMNEIVVVKWSIHVFLFFNCLQMTNLIRNQIRQCETVGCLSQAVSPRGKKRSLRSSTVAFEGQAFTFKREKASHIPLVVVTRFQTSLFRGHLESGQGSNTIVGAFLIFSHLYTVGLMLIALITYLD